MADTLERDFEDEMRRLYEEPKKRFRYNATYFLEMISSMGGVEAARKLAGEPGHHEGLTKLWECKALDLSVEYAVLQEHWAPLFSDEVRRVAKKKLEDLGMTF